MLVLSEGTAVITSQLCVKALQNRVVQLMAE